MSYDPTYAPFPEHELKALRRWHEQAADLWKTNSNMHREHTQRMQTCDNALAAHDALRTRFLEQTMTLRARDARIAELEAQLAQRVA